MSQHTPGPWTVKTYVDQHPAQQHRHEINSKDQHVCTLYVNMPAAAKCVAADARLIAAAPEMLALIRDYFEAYKDHPERLGSGSSAAHRAFTRARALLDRIDG